MSDPLFPLNPKGVSRPCWALVGPGGGPAAAAHRRQPRAEPEGTVPLGPGHILVPLTHGLGNRPCHSPWHSTGYRPAIFPHRRNRETHRMSERSSSYRPWQAHYVIQAVLEVELPVARGPIDPGAKDLAALLPG